MIGHAGAALACGRPSAISRFLSCWFAFVICRATIFTPSSAAAWAALTRRLNLLSRKPNLFLARPRQQRETADANYRHLIYELDDRGARLLKERGLSFLPKSFHRNFAHELMVSQITASFELGACGRQNIRLITWPEILANPKTPEALRQSATPTAIPVTFAANGAHHSIHVNADAQPFGLERVIDGARTYLFFPGIEADCGTEPIEASDFERSSIAKKFAAYISIAEQRIYRSHFGFPNFFVPLITPTKVRMESMMALLLRMTGGRGSKIFLFKTFPLLSSAEKSPPPDGHMLTESWQRAGFEPFCFTA